MQNIKTIIFGKDTRAVRLFDEILILAIILSIITVLLESVTEYRQQYGQILNSLEWFFTIIFTIEYFLRMYSVRIPTSYLFSFYGIIDLLAVIQTYISILLPE